MNKNSILYLVIETILFISIIIFGVNYYTNKLDISNQNLKVYKGKVEQLELKTGELINIRDSYITSISNLEEMLNISKKEIKQIQSVLDSKIAYISKLESTIKIDTTEMVRDSIVYVDNSPDHIIASFHYTDKWLEMYGRNDINLKNGINYKTTLDNLQVNIPLIVGLTEDYQIFVQSDNPYTNFTSIDGAVIDKKQFRKQNPWISYGLQFGFGLSYDIFNRDFNLGPYAGAGIQINF